MKISRRNFCLLMAGACCTGVLAACGSSSSSTASSSAASASAAASGEVRDELIFVNYRDIRDLNPHLYAGEMYAQSILYDTLVSITANGYEGCLAESWECSEDGLTWTFHLRKGVKWMTADMEEYGADVKRILSRNILSLRNPVLFRSIIIRLVY